MAAMGEGGHESADYSRIGDVESVRAVELVCAGRLLRMGCDPFLMSVCGFVGGGETLWEQNGLPWEHSAEKRWEGGETETERLILLRERGGGGAGSGEAETESLILWLVVLDFLAGGWLVV